MDKKVLITGASGQLGNSVIKILYKKYNLIATDININNINDTNISYEVLDITNSKNIKSIVSKYNPDIIINLASFTDVDGCELNPEKAHLINTKSVELVLENFDGQFIHISTDYVFDGLNGPYSERDSTNPLNVYGDTKLEAEMVLQDSSLNWCILRTNVLFDYFQGTSASFLNWVIDSLQSSKTINIVNDQWNNPTWTQNFAEIIELVINKNVKGIYNYGGADYLNRYEFAKIIADVYDLDKSLIFQTSTDNLNQPARRPLKGGLKTEKIEEEFDIKCVDLKTSLNMIKSQIAI